MIIVHYEVYVLEGRGWMLHARFPRAERDAAVAEAKEIEQSLHVRVKVLRETYFTDDNAFEEAEVYVSGKLPEKPRPAHASGHAAAGGRNVGYAPAGFGKSPFQNKRDAAEAARMRQLLGRLLAVVAISLAAAMLSIRITPDAILLLWKMGFVITLTRDSYGQMLFGVFVTSFLVVALPLALWLLPRKPHTAENSKLSLSQASDQIHEDPAHARKVRKSLNKLANQAVADGTQEKAESTSLDLADDLPEILPAAEESEFAVTKRDDDAELAASLEAKAREQLEAALKETSPPDSTAAETDWQQATPEPAPQSDNAPQADPAQNAPEQQPRKEAEATENVQAVVIRFLNGAVAQAKLTTPSMDAYTKFALHLYLAGAVETLCDFKKLGDGAKAKLVTMALETLGTKGDLARKFYEKLEEYLLEPRYLGVVQAGRNAMGDFMMGDEDGAHKPLRDVILEWNRKSDKKGQIVTVMFTDMVGSTDMTQARGDVAAQEVVRRHNAIVRGALAQFSGKEIKHTGDGIMASFPTAAAAVEASVAIQRQINQHNKRQGSADLRVRIGLNAGEPIEEEDDLFGTTVQLAARVCAATNPDEIQCTGVVKDLAFGKGAATFRSRGDKYLKGFKEAVPLFEVEWNN